MTPGPAPARRSRAGKTAHVGAGLYDVEVAGTTRVSPHLLRVRLAGDQLRAFRDDGPDQRVKLLLPRDDQDRPRLPPRHDGWYQWWLDADPATRPVVRTFTVRASRPELGEMDVDVALHEGPQGPAARWAVAARPGDRVGVVGAYAEWEPPPGTASVVMAADLCALPAAAAALAHLPAGVPAHLVLELADGADLSGLGGVPDGVAVRVVSERPDRPGDALCEAVADLPAWPAPTYAWFCAEQQTAAALRRHAVRERGVPADRVMFMGYWKRGRAEGED